MQTYHQQFWISYDESSAKVHFSLFKFVSHNIERFQKSLQRLFQRIFFVHARVH